MARSVKVCGVRDAVGLQACVDAGVTHVGFNFAPGSTRKIDVERARALVASIPSSGPVSVGVFRDQMPGDVMRIARSVGLAVIQLHGDEPPAYCAALGGFDVWKAVCDPEVSRATLEAYAEWCDALIVDGRNAGSGEGWDYARLRQILDPDGTVGDVPVLVAGGLLAENVAAAIGESGAAGADVASGVETDGAMDPAKVAAFAAAAQDAPSGGNE